MQGVASCIQHMIIIVCLQESRMALLEMIDHMVTGNTEISEYANFHRFVGNNKTVRVACIMEFRKACNSKSSDFNRFVCLKGCNHMPLYADALLLHCGIGDVYRQLILFG